MLLPPENEVCEGYVFTGVCLSTGEGLRGTWQGGGCAWQGGMRGRGVHGGGHGRGKCVTGGVWQGGMHGGGHVWWGHACMAGGACMPQQILQDTVSERTVRILLECFLVASSFSND